MNLTKLSTGPFTFFVADGLHDERLYRRLDSEFPRQAELHVLTGIGHKLHLNEAHANFKPFLRYSPAWSNFYRDLTQLEARVRQIVEFPVTKGYKFEFSALPGDGGFLPPHPDTAKKAATVVLFFPGNAWRRAWGGALEFYRHRTRPDDSFDDYKDVTWADVDTIYSAAFQENRMVGLVRTGNSLHGVRPLTGPPGSLRRSVTINFIL